MKAFWLKLSLLNFEKSLMCGWIELEKLFPNAESFCIRRRLLISWGFFLLLAMFVGSKIGGWKAREVVQGGGIL